MSYFNINSQDRELIAKLSICIGMTSKEVSIFKYYHTDAEYTSNEILFEQGSYF